MVPSAGGDGLGDEVGSSDIAVSWDKLLVGDSISGDLLRTYPF
jgi:hypothetical protein